MILDAKYHEHSESKQTSQTSQTSKVHAFVEHRLNSWYNGVRTKRGSNTIELPLKSTHVYGKRFYNGGYFSSLLSCIKIHSRIRVFVDAKKVTEERTSGFVFFERTRSVCI